MNPKTQKKASDQEETTSTEMQRKSNTKKVTFKKTNALLNQKASCPSLRLLSRRGQKTRKKRKKDQNECRWQYHHPSRGRIGHEVQDLPHRCRQHPAAFLHSPSPHRSFLSSLLFTPCRKDTSVLIFLCPLINLLLSGFFFLLSPFMQFHCSQVLMQIAKGWLSEDRPSARCLPEKAGRNAESKQHVAVDICSPIPSASQQCTPLERLPVGPLLPPCISSVPNHVAMVVYHSAVSDRVLECPDEMEWKGSDRLFRFHIELP
mmetsp:Transcript_10158/g.19691  ORF Transcript_10158/g.19691 Transcript_10158/m.19691 type:complete len:261 (+) Transcript_10158:275-1057(+)